MASENTPPETSDVQSSDNAKAAADAENILAELKAAENVEPTEAAATESTSDAKVDVASAEDQKPAAQEKPASETQDSSKDDAKNNHKSRDSYRGRGSFRSGRNNRSSGHHGDLTSLPETDDPQEIRRQVEFYFSDSNLPQDKFLFGQVGGSQNNPVDLKLINSFKRMRRFKPFSAIVAALKDSTFLDVIEKENEDIKIQRKTPLPKPDSNDGTDMVRVFEDRAMPRSIYAKGFGSEIPTTQFDIEAFFNPYGPTNAVRLRRADDKTFKGSVFVEFDSPETAEKFLKADPKPKWNGKDLLIMSKKAYVDQKAEDIRTGRIKPRETREKYTGKRKGDIDDRDWRERREQDQKNGFKKGRGFGSKRGRGDRRGDRDSRGVPQVKDSSQKEKDPETVAALEKAKAAVKDEEDKKETETNGTSPTAAAGTKRPREEDDAEIKAENGEPEAKKPATEAQVVEETKA